MTSTISSIGPAGVFTINSKYHEGMKVWVGSKRVLVNGQRTDHLRNAAYEAKRVTTLLTRATGLPIEAKPIVAIVAARSITVRERPTDVVVLSSTQLLRWLQRRPKLLTDEQSNQLHGGGPEPCNMGQPGPAAGGPGTLRRTPRKRRIREATTTDLGALCLLAPFAVAVAALLTVLR